VISSDKSLLLGKMADWTGNAGLIYPAAGSLEPRDVVDGRVRVLDSLTRELNEEMGLEASEAQVGTTLAIFEGPRVSVARGLHFSEDTDTLLGRVRANLEAQSERELADVVAVRTRRELEAAGEFPPYVGELMDAFEAGRFEC
jgi:hypothetical protein